MCPSVLLRPCNGAAIPYLPWLAAAHRLGRAMVHSPLCRVRYTLESHFPQAVLPKFHEAGPELPLRWPSAWQPKGPAIAKAVVHNLGSAFRSSVFI